MSPEVLAAASTSVGPAEHKKVGTTQVLVQGNATPEVARLLEGEGVRGLESKN